MLSFGKVSSSRSLQAHIAPLESECLLRAFGSFSGGCCHGFILLITLDIDIHMNVPFPAQADEWPWAVGEDLVAWGASWPGARCSKPVFQPLKKERP